MLDIEEVGASQVVKIDELTRALHNMHRNIKAVQTRLEEAACRSITSAHTSGSATSMWATSCYVVSARSPRRGISCSVGADRIA